MTLENARHISSVWRVNEIQYQYDEVLVMRFSYVLLYTIPEYLTVTVNIKHLICDNDIGKFTRYIYTISALFGARK